MSILGEDVGNTEGLSTLIRNSPHGEGLPENSHNPQQLSSFLFLFPL